MRCKIVGEEMVFLKRKKKSNVINFLCLKCGIEFDCDVGEIDFTMEDGMPGYEHSIVCSRCGAKYTGEGDNFSDNFELTEIGQSQMTELLFNSE